MKLSTSALTLLLSTLVASKSLSLFGSQKVLDDSLKVPGENPLEYCSPDRDSELLVLDYVNLTPNPPVTGSTLTIEASGTLLEDVEKDAYVLLEVKYGLIKLLTTKADLCEQVSNVDMECPIKKGLITITKDVEIPNEVPPGKYTVRADVYTAQDKKITCLTATVAFWR